MAWTLRPPGVVGFPDGTPADWGAQWFNPITAAGLNKVKNNLDWLHSRTVYYASPASPGSAFSLVTPNSPQRITFDIGQNVNIPSYNGGVIRAHFSMLFSANLASPTTNTFYVKLFVERASGGAPAPIAITWHSGVGSATLGGYMPMTLTTAYALGDWFALPANLNIYVEWSYTGTGSLQGRDPRMFVMEL